MIIYFTLGEHKKDKEREEFFNFMYKKYHNAVYKKVCDSVNDYHLREDVAQEIFIRFYKSMGRIQGETAAYRWLMKITHNTIIYMGKKEATYRKHMVLNLEEYEIYEACTYALGDNVPLETALKNEMSEKLSEAIGELKTIHHDVIALKYLYEFTPMEISEMYNIPLNTVYSRLSTAEDILRSELYEYVVGSDSEGGGSNE